MLNIQLLYQMLSVNLLTTHGQLKPFIIIIFHKSGFQVEFVSRTWKRYVITKSSEVLLLVPAYY